MLIYRSVWFLMNSGSWPPRCCRRSLLVRKVVGPLCVTSGPLALKPLICGIPAVRSRRGPRRRRPVKLRADKAYFSAEHLAWLRERGLVARIARPGIESGERLGRHR